MSAANKPMTTEELVEWEERQELRYEFAGLHPRAMVGGTVTHSMLLRNLAIDFGCLVSAANLLAAS